MPLQRLLRCFPKTLLVFKMGKNYSLRLLQFVGACFSNLASPFLVSMFGIFFATDENCEFKEDLIRLRYVQQLTVVCN